MCSKIKVQFFEIYNFVVLPSEKAMAPHSSTLAWKIPWTEEPGGLQSMGLLRVGHDWVTSLSLFTCMHWRRKWQPTPVFLPGESQGWGILVDCHLWGRTESDTTEATQQQQHFLMMCETQKANQTLHPRRCCHFYIPHETWVERLWVFKMWFLPHCVFPFQ